jgi:hypothetical protein
MSGRTSGVFCATSSDAESLSKTALTFNGELREECLNTKQFLSIADARSKIEAWRTGDNHLRAHGVLKQEHGGVLGCGNEGGD